MYKVEVLMKDGGLVGGRKVVKVFVRYGWKEREKKRSGRTVESCEESGQTVESSKGSRRTMEGSKESSRMTEGGKGSSRMVEGGEELESTV
ncbi:hypothetical protein LR48_Vigan11g159000 [Vigna angularis]|uniref:Uncharacterized protein n=1 Tax=Phaseolus angularis TaxID=3914 RepID=A0A0L9VU02_PHAAN|nr:hypothetical protein LR48_Vigan11g159000 [Vigna angularis]